MECVQDPARYCPRLQPSRYHTENGRGRTWSTGRTQQPQKEPIDTKHVREWHTLRLSCQTIGVRTRSNLPCRWVCTSTREVGSGRRCWGPNDRTVSNDEHARPAASQLSARTNLGAELTKSFCHQSVTSDGGRPSLSEGAPRSRLQLRTPCLFVLTG